MSINKVINKNLLILLGIPLGILFSGVVVIFYVLFQSFENPQTKPFSISYQKNIIMIAQELKKLEKQKKEVKNLKIFRLKRNPFMYATQIKSETPKPVVLGNKAKKKKTYTLHLSMVFKSEDRKNSFCIINGKVYKEGNKIFKKLKIQRIGDYYVVLEMGKKKVFLEVGKSFRFTI